MDPFHLIRPFQTPVPEPATDAMTFEQAIQSLIGYADFEQIPPVFFRRIRRILEQEGKTLDDATEPIARLARVSRDAVLDRLTKCGPPVSRSAPDEVFPRREELLRSYLIRRRY